MSPKGVYVRRELAHAKWVRYRDRLKAEAVAAYGGRCAHCGEDDPVVLQLAHRYRDGAARHRESGRRLVGTNLIRRIKQEGWPDWILLLCANCHLRYDAKES